MVKQFTSVAASAALALLVATALFAQSEAPRQSEAPKTAKGVELGGYCPVAYVAMNQAVKGSPEHKSVHQGKTYHLTNADAKKMFDAAPARYLPAYDGLCATGVAMGMKLESDPALFAVHNGRAYLFSDAEAKAMFEKDTRGIIAKADANWPKVQKKQ
ncbi:MAG: twin-arginine translocation pathway signal protein [Acidobacteria bacterium]|nr:twin-arginine translocation pathway signal protein [Acidobacteriota bacterium]